MKRPSVHIVTHCYAERLPHYAAALRYQLSSLVLHTPNARVVAEVCFCPTDGATRSVLQSLAHRQQFLLKPRPMDLASLGRRSIGRNAAALESQADVVWFTDADYAFGDGCLDSMVAAVQAQPPDAVLFYPSELRISKTHETGNKLLAVQPSSVTGLCEIEDEEDFAIMETGRAFGGIQIVRGDTARQLGYLPNSRYQTPTTTPFGDFRDDVAFRRQMGRVGGAVAIKVPNVFRIRHLETSYQRR